MSFIITKTQDNKMKNKNKYWPGASLDKPARVLGHA